MKKSLLSVITFLLILVVLTSPSYAVGVNIDNQAVTFTESSGAPFIDQANRTQVPFRQTMERFGCTVSWDEINKIAVAEKDGITVQVPIGASYIIKNGQQIKNDTAALIKDNRTYLPIRAVLEAFGADVSWDAKAQTVFAFSSGDNNIANLINQSNYFKGAPKELYVGKALKGSFSSQGVTVKYRAAFSDGEAVYLFFDLIDTGANLFSGGSSKGRDLSINQYDFLEKSGYTDSKVYDVISYDEKTKTATICVEYIGPLKHDSISFHIYSMSGNQKGINFTLDNFNLYEQLKKTAGEFEPEEQFAGTSTSFGIFDEKTGQTQSIDMPDFEEGNGNSVYRLKKDALSLPLKDEKGSHVADITNIGWRNGWLHVQINPENNIKWETGFNLKHNKTGALLYSPFHASFGTRADGKGQDDYYEYMFYVGNLTDENLDYSIAFRNETYKATDLTGDWAISFAIPDTLVKKLEVNKPIPVKGHDLLLRRAVISPVKITLFASRKDVPEDLTNWFYELSPNDLLLKIVYKDGKTADIPKQSRYAHANQKGDMFRITYTAENFDDIAGLEVNGVRLSVAD